MKKKRINRFIQYLYNKNEWLKVDELATHFNISPRTIRNYINEVNSLPFSKPLITEKNNYYRINKEIYVKYSTQKEAGSHNPETPGERMKYVMRELIYNEHGIDVFDLSESLFLSISSIENDLNKIREILKSYKLELIRNKDRIILVGSERNKRKLMNQFYYDEYVHLSDLSKIQTEFYGYNFNELKKIVSTTLSKHNLFLSEYTMNDVLLHIVISIERMKEKNYVENAEDVDQLEKTTEYKAALEIAKEMESKSDVIFDLSELYYLTLLLITKTTILRYNEVNEKNINNFIEEKYTKLTEKIVYKVNKFFFLDIDDEEFKVKFTLHLKNLIRRAKFDRFSKNPLTKKIKYSYPLIYDLSVFMANEIQKEVGIVINEDEIAYISFHLGAFFERKQGLEGKVLCAVICPDYYGTQAGLISKLSKRFHDSLEIVRVASSTEELLQLSHSELDLIITTLDVPPFINIEFIQVNLFLTDQDKKTLHKKIEELKLIKYYDNIQSYLDRYFEPLLFEKNIYFKDEFQIIHYMGDKLEELGYVDRNYVQSIIEREKMSSTAFNNIVAMPHSMQMNAEKTTISITINDKPQVWSDSSVQIIAMITMNEQERKEFRHIFDSFINVLSEVENVHRLVQSETYDEFIEILSSMMRHKIF